ncbi:MAG: molybdopterin molybdotransferase MoeA [Gammaproteobacteria bacterium]
MLDKCSLESEPLLSIDEALDRIQAAILPVAEEERVGLKKALGRVLAQSVYSPINIPFDRNAAMDGYALCRSDISPDRPFSLRLVGVSWAGKPFQGQLRSGECIRIFTGAVVPPQADSVVMQEEVEIDGDRALFPANIKACQNIREAGEDILQNSILCAQSKKLTATDLALLASAGIGDVPVKRRIKIAFFSTGDELTPIGQPLEPGNIYDSNRYGLFGLLTDPCFNITDKGTMPDDKELLENCLRSAANDYDAIISTGGASVGEADYINELLDRCGEVNFWKLAIKPGKPLAFGKIGQSYFFGLPGNPVSVIVTYRQIVAPALRRLAGAGRVKPLRLKATCTSRLKKKPGRQEFQRGVLNQDDNGDWFVASSGKQGSHMLSSMSHSQCYIVLPSECGGVEPGDTVIVEPFTVWL